MILSGEYQPGDRLIEERLTKQLDISRPPLREAMRLIQQQGLITVVPRKGAIVVDLTFDDAWEIVTLRSALERFALETALPLQHPELLEPCREAIEAMRRDAVDGDAEAMVLHGYGFHRALVSLARHRRLEEIYDSLYQQLILCMRMNLYARRQRAESLSEHAARHERLLHVVESGDRRAALKALAAHGEQLFLRDGRDAFPGHPMLTHE